MIDTIEQPSTTKEVHVLLYCFMSAFYDPKAQDTLIEGGVNHYKASMYANST